MAGKRKRPKGWRPAVILRADGTPRPTLDTELAAENALRKERDHPPLSRATQKRWRQEEDRANTDPRLRPTATERSNRTLEPRAVIEDLLRERSGIVLHHVLAKLQRRARRPIDPVEQSDLLAIAERAIAGLVDVGEHVLVDDTGTLAEWRANFGRQSWHAERLRDAAEAVGLLRALGHRRGAACRLAQEKLGFQHDKPRKAKVTQGTPKRRDSDQRRQLAKMLDRAHRAGVFAGLSFPWPSRAEARNILEHNFGDVARTLPIGPLPEQSEPPCPMDLVPGHNKLWWSDHVRATRRDSDDSQDSARPRRGARRQNRVDRLAQTAEDAQSRLVDQDAGAARSRKSRRRAR